MFASMKTSHECIWIYAASVVSRCHFLDKNISRIRVSHEQDANVSVYSVCNGHLMHAMIMLTSHLSVAMFT